MTSSFRFRGELRRDAVARITETKHPLHQLTGPGN